MNTTALIAELFVSGILTTTWVFFIVMRIFNIGPTMAFYEKYSAYGILLFSAFAYVLGVIFDRIWDAFSKNINKSIEKKYYLNPKNLEATRKNIFGKNQEGAEFINYIRSRMRIARSAAYNLPLVGTFGIILYINQNGPVSLLRVFAIFVLTLALTLISFFAFTNTLHTYYKSLAMFMKEENAKHT